MRRKLQLYKFWEIVKKYAEEKDISYSQALTELLPAFTAMFYKLDPPRRYPEELLVKARQIMEKYGGGEF